MVQKKFLETENRTDDKEFQIKNGKLHKYIIHDLYLNKDTPGDRWKLCIPKEKRLEILTQMHDDPTAGHMGVAKTIARLAKLYYWPGMFHTWRSAFLSN